MKKHNVKTFLQSIVDNKPKSLEAYVANEALKHDNIKSFFEDYINHGSVGEMVTSLIQYYNTHEILDIRYDQIIEVKWFYENDCEQSINYIGDLKDFLAWFTFVYIADCLYNNIDFNDGCS